MVDHRPCSSIGHRPKGKKGKKKKEEKFKKKNEDSMKKMKRLTSEAHLDMWQPLNGVSYRLCRKTNLRNILKQSFDVIE